VNPYNFFNKRVYIFLGILLVGVLIYGIFLDKGTLEINAKPVEISVKVKNKTYTTPLKIKLREGNYKITATKDGYIDQETTIRIKPFKTTKLYFDMISTQVIEPTHFTIPDEVNQLPINTDHFRIYFTYDINTFTISPHINYTNENPKTFMEENWDKYEQYAYEALDWLDDHGLGKDVRTKNSMEIDWVMKEFWPAGTSINY